MGFALFGGSLFVCIYFQGDSSLYSLCSCHCAAFVYILTLSKLMSFGINHCLYSNSSFIFSSLFSLSSILQQDTPTRISYRKFKCKMCKNGLLSFPKSLPQLTKTTDSQEAECYNSKNQRLCKLPMFKIFPVVQLLLNLLCISFFICRMGGHNKNTAFVDLCGFSKVAYIRLRTVPSIQEGLHQC